MLTTSPTPSRPARAFRLIRILVSLTLLGALLAISGVARTLPAADSAAMVGNGQIAFVTDRDGDAEIYLMNWDGSGLIDLTNDPGADADPAWAPSGVRLAFASDRDGTSHIYVMNADGTGVSRLTSTPDPDSQPTWSPDGTKLAFTRTLGANSEIYSMNADGSAQTNLTNDPAAESDAAWSPDGAEIAFSSDRGGNRDVYAMAADGSGVTDLTTNPAEDSQPAWSADGARIAFSTDRTGNEEIDVMNADGTGAVDVTNDPGQDSQPFFSPDQGARLSFTSDRSGDDDLYLLNLAPDRTTFGVADATQNGASDSGARWQPLPAPPPSGSPIEHVVVLYMENHTFDNVFGRFCLRSHRCDGATTGKLDDGTTIALATAPDLVPDVDHTIAAQKTSVNGGEMNGFSLIDGCTQDTGYACYSQFNPQQIPNLSALARHFVVSDRTFQMDSVPSWGAHLELAAADLDGFNGNNPGYKPTAGWGCDSEKEARWRPTIYDLYTELPSCVPKQDGTGPYLPSTASWVPTIMDRMDAAALSWRLYVPQPNDPKPAYGWAICPSFAECFYGPQAANVYPPDQFANDAAAGDLPALSIVTPINPNSQHNENSMLVGDNWIARQVRAVMHGADWASSVVFITYDDCGCFYDHVPPPTGLGIRSPMVIVSPYAKPGYTDSIVASYASLLAYVEHTFGLAPLSTRDATAYDYSQSFDYAQPPQPPIPLTEHQMPRWERQWIRSHPPDPDDPT